MDELHLVRLGVRQRQRAVIAVKSAVDEHDALTELLPLAGGGLLIVFSAWWIYFAVPVHAGLTTSRRAFLWGYGHYVVLASVAGIGAGIEIAVEDVVDQAPISSLGAAATATVPTAIYLVSVWALHVRRYQVDPRRWRQGVPPVAAGLVLACTLLTEWAEPAAGVVCAGAVVVGVAADGNRGEERAGGGWGGRRGGVGRGGVGGEGPHQEPARTKTRAPRYVFRGPARGPLASGPGMTVASCRSDDLGGGVTGSVGCRHRR
ncbi:low temperature requirement protein A [Streptomyces albidoflavus]|uniref:low temperature requirement protein A n=1 Tax=Streptomyces albidoflavus TaxID=1886 RepID=UPI003D9F5DF2